MAITSYSELKTAVAAWLHRTDLTEQIPDFITLAETHLNADMEARQMETRYSFTLTTGSAYYTLPDDLLETRRLIVLSEPVSLLTYATPDEMAVDFPTTRTGVPQVFAVLGNELQLGPAPDAAYVAELLYRQRLTPLSDTNTSNWLLDKYPNAYLYGALLAAQFYVEDENKLGFIQAAYQEAVANINSVSWYSGSTMTVRAS